jgi:hypothetical protein
MATGTTALTAEEGTIAAEVEAEDGDYSNLSNLYNTNMIASNAQPSRADQKPQAIIKLSSIFVS